MRKTEFGFGKPTGLEKGKKIKDNRIYKSHQDATQLQVVSDFTQTTARKTKSKESETGKEDDNGGEEGLYECSEGQCNCTFLSVEDLEIHVDFGQHSRTSKSESVYDTLRREWAKTYRTVSFKDPTFSRATEGTQRKQVSSLKMGWALSKPRTSARFSNEVRHYLIQKFEVGETTGHKSNPDQVASDMRNARDENGSRLFSRDQWLTQAQIKSFFSR